MIIIEGPDGAGKTTLAHQLGKEFGLRIEQVPNRERMPQTARERVYEAISQTFESLAPVMIHDRLYFSELVYGQVLRGKVHFSVWEQRVVEGVLKSLEIPMVFCLPHMETVRENLRQKDHIEGAADHIDEICEEYHGIWLPMSDMSPFVHRYDYAGPDAEAQRIQVRASVRRYLEKRRERVW